MELTQEPSWMDPIVAHLKTGEQPEDKTEAQILWRKVARYVLYDDELYRKGYTMPLLKCVTLLEAKNIMREIHKGTCGNHVEGQSLAFKVIRQGYYWLTMKMDCTEYTHKCDKCQLFAPISKVHPEELTYMTSLWPFFVWGIDLIGRLPKERGSV